LIYIENTKIGISDVERIDRQREGTPQTGVPRETAAKINGSADGRADRQTAKEKRNGKLKPRGKLGTD